MKIRKIVALTFALIFATGAVAQTAVVRTQPAQLELQKADPKLVIQSKRETGGLAIHANAIAATYGGLLNGNANLYFRSGDIYYEAKDWLDPTDKNFKRTFHWDVEDSPNAVGAVWQISSHPFPPTLSISDDPLAPQGLLRSGFSAGKRGVFDKDFAVLAQERGLRPKPVQATINRSQLQARTTIIAPAPQTDNTDQPATRSAPSILKKKEPVQQVQPLVAGQAQLELSDAALAGFVASGGYAMFYVRVLPVIGDAQHQKVIGYPSDVGEIRYGNRPPPENPFAGFEWRQKDVPQLAVTAFSYTPWRFDERWPKGCKVFRGGNDYWNPLDFLLDAWDWASETYADIKTAVVDLTAGLLPFVPREAFEFALDAALASAGIPPSLPNIDQMMEEGAGYLAEEAVGEIMGPVGSKLTEDIAGELFDDLAADMIAELSAEALHDRVQDEMRGRLKSQIESSARGARAAIESNAKETRCQTREYQPTIRITIRNRTNKRYTDVPVTIGDEVGIFKSHSPKITLRPNEQYDLVLPMYPDFWKIAGRNNVSLYDARDHYWREYAQTPTKFVVRGPDITECYESEYGYVIQCNSAPATDRRPLRFSSPGVVLINPFRL